MVGVLKIEGLNDNVIAGELKRYFKENGARPEDVHIKKDRREATAFLIFAERREIELGLQADGCIFQDRELMVRETNPKEFNRFFPGIPMISNQTENKFNKQEEVLVIKVEGLDIRTNVSEIRKYFGDKGIHPVEIHVSSIKGRNYNEFGTAFLVFTNRREAKNVLRADGTFYRNQRLTVRISSPFEFDQYFPGVPMISVIAKQEKTRNNGFQGVIKVDNIDFAARPGDVRRYFKDNNARPDDIHFIKGPNGQHEGSALLIFSDQREMETALQANGTFFQGRRLTVRQSNPKEFNRFFPGVNMFSSKGENVSSGEFGRGRNQRGNFQDSTTTVRDNRGRSRSPIGNNKDERTKPQFFNTFAGPPATETPDPLADVEEEKFVRMTGLPYDVSATQLVNYFQPIAVREMFILKHTSGKFKGQTNGSAVVEFFAKNTARRAVEEYDGRYINQRLVNIRYAAKEDICRALQIPYNAETQPSPPGPSSGNDVANGNTQQMQHLLNLLTATVSAMAGQQPQLPPADEPMRAPRRDDSVVNRVASSANINVNDIRRGCVVGMRNLPYSVKVDEIMQFFDGYHIIPNSIRIHFLDNGKCSGDAVVSFHGNRDARNAVSALNRKTIGRRRVELFFL